MDNTITPGSRITYSEPDQRFLRYGVTITGRLRSGVALAVHGYPLHDPRIDLMIWAEQTGVHGRHDGGVVGACIGMACERKELDGLL
jgi:hypothetical protein